MRKGWILIGLFAMIAFFCLFLGLNFQIFGLLIFLFLFFISFGYFMAGGSSSGSYEPSIDSSRGSNDDRVPTNHGVYNPEVREAVRENERYQRAQDEAAEQRQSIHNSLYPEDK